MTVTDLGNVFRTWRNDDDLAKALRDAARGQGMPADYALPLAVGMIDRLLARVRVLEATMNGRFLGEDAAQ